MNNNQKSFRLDMGKEANLKSLGAIIPILIIAGLIWYFYGGGLQKHADVQMQNISNKVASDAVEQYNIAKRQGDKTQICVQAELVSSAYLQAKDEANYTKWKAVESADCAY